MKQEKKKLKITALKKKLAQTPGSDLKTRCTIYLILKELDPNNQGYHIQYNLYMKLLREQKEAERKLALAREMKRNTTNEDCVACFSRQWLADMVAFRAANDRANFNAYISSKKCIIMKGGVKVAIMQYPGMFGEMACFAYRGVKFWTTRDSLNY